LVIETVDLKEASKLEIVSLMDNNVDFLSSNTRKEVQSLRHWTKEQYGPEWAQTYTELPFAEHGFSMLIRVFSGEKACAVLFDTGVSLYGVVANAERMGINLEEVSCVVLSHGHYDHFGGLAAVVKDINKIDLPIIAHEDMARRRGTANSKGEIKEYQNFPNLNELKPTKIVNTKKSLLIAQDLACVTGEIPRTVDFEKGLTQNRIFKENTWQPDPLILDERALVFNVKSKGLVIISGCSHAGIINTIRYAQQITDTAKVYAVLGGFHLAGKEYEKRIKPTIEMLKQINPALIAPSHCTGWRAIQAIQEKFSDAYISNSVGNLYLL
jgi:7,8-dihydropterin-6-yl-methyl-4-(beta-D-ribofuranosyl)aminobenzene 5'-phosphate synthase